MNETPRSTSLFNVASDSVSSTSPYTGVNAIAPNPIALTDNSSPSVTAGTEFALVMILPSRFGGRSRSWTRRARPIGQPPVTGDDAPTVCQPAVVRSYSAVVPAKWSSLALTRELAAGNAISRVDAQALRPIDQRHQAHGDVADCDASRGGGVSA